VRSFIWFLDNKIKKVKVNKKKEMTWVCNITIKWEVIFTIVDETKKYWGFFKFCNINHNLCWFSDMWSITSNI